MLPDPKVARLSVRHQKKYRFVYDEYNSFCNLKRALLKGARAKALRDALERRKHPPMIPKLYLLVVAQPTLPRAENAECRANTGLV